MKMPRRTCGLYYYKREDSTLKEDFFVRTASELIPVEVRATNGRAKSLRTLIGSEKYSDISHGIKLTGGNIGYSGNIYTFPYCRNKFQHLQAGDFSEPLSLPHSSHWTM